MCLKLKPPRTTNILTEQGLKEVLTIIFQQIVILTTSWATQPCPGFLMSALSLSVSLSLSIFPIATCNSLSKDFFFKSSNPFYFVNIASGSIKLGTLLEDINIYMLDYIYIITDWQSTIIVIVAHFIVLFNFVMV